MGVVYLRNEIAVSLVLFVLVQFCCGNSVTSKEPEGKTAFPSANDTTHEEKSQSASENLKPKANELPENASLTTRTCPSDPSSRSEIISYLKYHMTCGKRCEVAAAANTRMNSKSTAIFKRSISENREILVKELSQKDPDTPLQCTPGETRCCREPTSVSLKRLFPSVNIIAPDVIETGYCRGSCRKWSALEHQNVSCCVPTEKKSLFMLYHGELPPPDFNAKIFLDMIIEKCGCR